MKLHFKIIIFISLVLISVAAYIYTNNIKREQSTEKVKEKIICSSTAEPRCFRYKCETSYFPELLPPGGPGRCVDGSIPTQLEKVPLDSIKK